VRRVKTKNGIQAIIVNNMVIRLVDNKPRLVEDDETFPEYKVRQRLIPKLKKQFKIMRYDK